MADQTCNAPALPNKVDVANLLHPGPPPPAALLPQFQRGSSRRRKVRKTLGQSWLPQKSPWPEVRAPAKKGRHRRPAPALSLTTVPTEPGDKVAAPLPGPIGTPGWSVHKSDGAAPAPAGQGTVSSATRHWVTAVTVGLSLTGPRNSPGNEHSFRATFLGQQWGVCVFLVSLSFAYSRTSFVIHGTLATTRTLPQARANLSRLPKKSPTCQKLCPEREV